MMSVMAEPQVQILALDEDLEDARVENSSYDSTFTLLEHEVAVWDPNAIFENYRSGKPYEGCPCFTDDASAAFGRDRPRREAEMVEFLELGRLLVVHTPAPRDFFVATGEERNDGTAATPRMVRLVTRVELADLIPAVPRLHAAEGNRVEIVGGEAFATFWEQVGDQFQYASFIEVESGTPLLRVPKTSRIVATVVEVKSGRVLFLPQRPLVELDLKQRRNESDEAFDRRWDKQSEELHESRDGAFVDALLTLARNLGSGPEEPLPSWTESLVLPGEAEAALSAKKAAKRVETAQRTASKARVNLQQLQRRKKLLTAAGEELEALIDEAFSDLGCEVSAGRPGRTDRILHWKSQVAVLESKGLTKSAKESNAAQLEKWVSEYAVEHDEIPKGILVVNAWRKAPLPERDEAPFPSQMIPYAEQRGHCLLSTSQLLTAWVTASAAAKRNAFLQAVFKNVGILEGWDWEDALTEIVGEDEA
jgi:hypothetical protein